MPLPNQALVFVTDGRKLLFLRNHGDENQIDLRVERHDFERRGPQGQRHQVGCRPGAIEAKLRLRPPGAWWKPTSASRTKTAG